jgi:hypothetical protein
MYSISRLFTKTRSEGSLIFVDPASRFQVLGGSISKMEDETMMIKRQAAVSMSYGYFMA